MKCPTCGTEIDIRAVFCQQCGTRLDAELQQFPPETDEINNESDTGFPAPQTEPTVTTPPASIVDTPVAEPETEPEGPAPTAAERMRGQTVGGTGKVDTPQDTLWKGGYSGKAMVGPWFLCLIVTIVILAVAIKFASGGTWWGIALGILGICWVVPTLRYLYRKLSVRYELTNHRFVHQTGIIIRTTDRIELVDITDIKYTQSIVDRMFGVGTITIYSKDASHGTLPLPGIEDVKSVYTKMEEARREEQLRREVHLEGR